MRIPARRARRTATGCSGSGPRSQRSSGSTEWTTGAAGRAELGTCSVISGPTTLCPSSCGSAGSGTRLVGSKYSRKRVEALNR